MADELFSPEPLRPDGLGQRIRKLRHERGMSLAKVARDDFSRAFLNQIEMGRARPSIRVLRVIADRLQAPVEYLLEGGLPTTDREIAAERGRIAAVLGRWREALMTLEPAVDSTEWPLGADARITRVAALVALERLDDANELAASVRQEVEEHRDSFRLRRLQAALEGRPYATPPSELLERAQRLLFLGRQNEALENLRTARTLLEAQSAGLRKARKAEL